MVQRYDGTMVQWCNGITAIGDFKIYLLTVVSFEG